jgi:hypothetical protein
VTRSSGASRAVNVEIVTPIHRWRCLDGDADGGAIEVFEDAIRDEPESIDSLSVAAPIELDESRPSPNKQMPFRLGIAMFTVILFGSAGYSAAAPSDYRSVAWARATASQDVIDFLHRGYALGFAGSGRASEYRCARVTLSRFRCTGWYRYRSTRAGLTINFIGTTSVVDTRVQVRRCVGAVCPLRKWRYAAGDWRNVG